MRMPPIPRRWLIAGSIGVGALLLLALTLGVIYPRVGAWMIRDKVAGKLAKRLGRNVTFADIDVRLGHATLRGIDVRGPNDGDLPLVHVDRVDVDFNTWSSFVGSVKVGAVKVDGVVVSVRRDSEGRDNISDLLEKKSGGEGGGSSLSTYRPTKITVTHARLIADDAQNGATATIADGDATWTPTELVAHARELKATTSGPPKATLATLEIHKASGQPPRVSLDGGEISLWPRMALSGIGGQIV